MPGAHTHIYTDILTLLIYINTMAQDHGLCRKKEKSQNRCTGCLCRPVLQLPTGQFRSLQTCWYLILAHMEGTGANKSKLNGGKANLNGGKNVEEGSGHGRQRVDRHTACRTGTAGKHSRRTLRPAQALKQTASSWPASQQKQQLPDDVGLPLAVQCR